MVSGAAQGVTKEGGHRYCWECGHRGKRMKAKQWWSDDARGGGEGCGVITCGRGKVTGGTRGSRMGGLRVAQAIRGDMRAWL